MSGFDPPYLVISSGHDYRSKKRANIHFITDELALRGETMFLSTHSSFVSAALGKDSRFREFSMHCRTSNGVECYLWRSFVHPFNVNSRFGIVWNSPAHALYRLNAPNRVKEMIRAAKTVIIESGSAIALLTLVKRINPGCAVIYNASDSLATIGLANYFVQCLDRGSQHISYVRLPSKLMASDHSSIKEQRVIRHGLDRRFFQQGFQNPYEAGQQVVVSVGSMLFDQAFFEIAASAYPDVKFYIIGSGCDGPKLPNTVWLPEMAFIDTIPYIKGASVGVAPYKSAFTSDYLIDTSMKLLQFEAAGLPAVCPDFVHGGKQSRIGYRVGDGRSIVEALRLALSMPRTEPSSPQTWERVVDAMLEPSKGHDC